MVESSLNIDKNFLNSLEKADAMINNITASAQKMSKIVTESFSNVNNNALKPFIENLNGIKKALDSKSTPIIFKEVGSQASQVVDKINKISTTLDKVFVGGKVYKFGALEKINYEIDEAVKKLAILQGKLNFYAKGEGQKAIGFVDTSAIQRDAELLMKKIKILEDERKSIIENAKIRIQESQKQEQIDKQWMKMTAEKTKRDKEATEASVKAIGEQYRAYERLFDQAIQREEALKKKKIESYGEQYRAYEEMFKKIEEKEKARYNDVINQINKEEQARKKALNTPQQSNKTLSDVTTWRTLQSSIARAEQEIARLNKSVRMYEDTMNRIKKTGSGHISTEAQREYPENLKNIEALKQKIATLQQIQLQIIQNNKALHEQLVAEQRLRDVSSLRPSMADLRSQDELRRMREYYKQLERDSAKAEKEATRAAEKAAKERQKANEKAAREAEKAREREAKAAEEAARREIIAAERAKQARIKQYKQQNYANNTTYQGALDFSNEAKTINRRTKAIQYLTEARNKLSQSDSQYEQKVYALNRAIKQHSDEIQRLTRRNDELRKSHSNLLDTSSQLQRKLALLFSVSAIQGYMDKLVSVRKEFELQQKSLQVLLQSKMEADKLWNQTIELAVHSPFRVKELVTYTRQLAAYRIETNKLHDTTKRLADVSAGLGVDMQRLILAFGQVRAANFLRGTELRQFTEAGIPMLDELAKHFTILEGKAISAGDVFEMISKRMVTFADVEAVFHRMTNEGGTFFEMQEEQSKTLAGMIANLHDSIDLMLNDIGKSYDESIKGTVNFAKFFIENWKGVAEAIKLVLVALASYKINQLVINSSLIAQAKAYGIVTAAEVKNLSIKELLRVKTMQLTTSMKGATAAWSAFLSVNLPLLAATALLRVLWEIVSAAKEHKKALDDISKEYEELRNNAEKISVDFSVAVDEKDIKTQKEKLMDLISLAKNDYNISIDVDVSNLNEKEIKSKFESIFSDVYEANIFAENFAKEMQKTTEWVVEDDVFEDLNQLGVSANEMLNEFAKNREKIVFRLMNMQGKLTEDQKEALEKLSKGRQSDESEFDYLDRLSKGYKALTKEYKDFFDKFMGSKGSERVKMHPELNKLRKELSLFGINAANIGSTIFKYEDSIREAKEEFNKFLEAIELADNLTEDEKIIRLQAAINKQASEKNWNDFVKNHIYKWIKQKFDVDISPKPPKQKELKNWQKSYNQLFKGFEGFREITQDTTKQTEIIDRLNASIKETEGLIKRINAAGGIKATLSGGAYEGQDLEALNRALTELREQQKWFGEINKKDSKDSNDLLKKQISLIKEMHNQYKQINQEFDDSIAKEKVITSYAESFREIFGEAGISLSGRLIDDKAIANLKESGTVSEDVIKKLEELSEKGTYIRTFSEDFVSSIKYAEGFIQKARDIGDGVLTIGYGETKGVKEGDVISKEEADLKLRTRLTEDFVKSLNKVLDANQDIILTQEQYNALLDLTYQGGEGAVRRLIEYSKNEDKALLHIQSVYEKIKAQFGEKDAERFGQAFIDKFKEAENIYDRIALLLQTMNLTVKGGKISERLYSGMQKRSDERASVFATGKEISKIVKDASVEISQINIDSAKGVVESLKKLIPFAKSIGKEAYIALQKAIDEYESEIELKPKVSERENIQQEVEDLFSGYEISLELEKLHVPSDFAEQLLGVEAITLPELRFKTLEKYGLKDLIDLSNEEIFNSDQFKGLSDNYEKEVREALSKISEMENKQQLERLKKYTQYLIKAQSERVKIKMDEIRQLQEIEDTFQLKENVAKSELLGMTNAQWNEYSKIVKANEEINETKLKSIGLTDEQIKKVLEYNKQMETSKQLAQEGVKKETQQKVDKAVWDEFKGSAMYEQLFGDLENLGTKSINVLMDKLKDMREALKQLPPEVYKEIQTRLDKLSELKMERNPLSEFKKAFEEIEDLRKKRVSYTDDGGKEITLKGEDAIVYELQLEEEKAEKIREQIQLYQQINAANGDINTLKEVGISLTDEQTKLLGDNEAINREILKLQEDLGKAEEAAREKGEDVQKFKTARESLTKVKDATTKWGEAISGVLGGVDEILDAFGVAEDDTARLWVNNAMQIADMTVQVIILTASLKAMGVAANTALGVVGWIAMALQGVAMIFANLFTMGDKKKERQIQREIELVEELENKYKKLEKAIDNAYALNTLQRSGQQAKSNINQQIAAYERMIQAEKDKKKTDEGRIKEWKQTIEDLREQKAELDKEIVGTATGGVLDDVLSAAQDFTNAWLDAFNETGDGLDGLSRNFKETMLEMVKQQASMLISQSYIDKWKHQLSQYINPDDLELTTDEARRWVDSVTSSLPQLNEALERYFLAMKEAGVDLTGGNSELSGLQRGIQGITEQQADILAAYLNSIRFFVSDNNTYLSRIAESLGNTEIENPMVGQLRIIASQTTAINELLNSLTSGGHSMGGRGFRVFIS